MHESTDVWAIRFDNGDTLGVTGSHPIYSLDANGWVLASTLFAGNQVLTKSGAATVTSVKKLSGRRKVYNLEVRDLHNFLVGDCGVVVHNNYGIAHSIVETVMAAIPASFKKYGKCKEFANALRIQLKSIGVDNPKCYVAKVVNSNGKRVNVQLWHNGVKVADNGIHVFTPVNNKIFDNMNHNGLQTSLFDYMKVDYNATGVGFETQFANGYDVVFREIKIGEDILKIND